MSEMFLILLLSCSMIGFVVGEGCGEDWWIEGVGNCYYFSWVQDSEYFFSGRRACENVGGFLAEPRTQQEIDFLKEEATKRAASFWIGGYRKSRYGGTFVWKTNYDPITLTDWHTTTSNEPNNENGSEHCVEIRDNLDYEWNDLNCYRSRRYICQKQK